MSKAKSVARASRTAAGPSDGTAILTDAYQRLFSGNGTAQDGEIVLTNLCDVFQYFQRPTYAEWLATHPTGEGFALHSALSNARTEVVQHILSFLQISDDQRFALAEAARLERARFSAMMRPAEEDDL